MALNIFISELNNRMANASNYEQAHVKPIKEETQFVNLGTDNEPKIVQIGNILTTKREKWTDLTTSRLQFFAWSYEDMPSINTNIVQHRIPTNPTIKLAK